MANRIVMPVTGGVARVPMVMQMEARECGAACLDMILGYYRKWVPLEQVRIDCGICRDGSNASNLLKAAKHYGLRGRGYRFEPDALRENGIFPCIIHWNFNHFVVLCGFRGDQAYLNDPARGAYTVSMKTFDESFTGICLCMEPDEGFEPGGMPKNSLSSVVRRLKGNGGALLFLAVTGVITAAAALLNAGFLSGFYDRVLSRTTPEWAMPLLILWGVLYLICILSSGLYEIYSRRLEGKMAAKGNVSFMWKLLCLPTVFFSQRMSGDILERKNENAAVSHTLISVFLPLALQLTVSALYFAVMVHYSWLLALIGVVSMTVNWLISRMISRKQSNLTRIRLRDKAKLNAYTVAGISMAETVKSSGAENGFFAKWSGYQASVNSQQVSARKTEQYLGMIPRLISLITGDMIMILGIYLVVRGEFTVGTVAALCALAGYFTSPVLTMIPAGQTAQETVTQMDRLDDVMEYPEEQIFGDEVLEREESYHKLSGSIQLKNVTFGYSPLDQPLIRDFSLTVEPGTSVAIVGSSGCGKSTMAKLVSGLYQPWSGEILFDGKPLKEIEKSVFNGSVAVVDQEIILFEDTIANNIKMWDDSIEDFEMILAARDARIHEDILQRPDGYMGKISEGGRDISGGQRQQMEIARVLAQDPTVIILDEATSALDALTEFEVVKAIKDRGITTVVIAHRLSTVRSCDVIILMDRGQIVARGTHDQLMQTSPLYRELVTNE